jgi:hypothetical protein
MTINTENYIAPDAFIVEVGVERGFDMSNTIGDWGDGESADGDAE